MANSDAERATAARGEAAQAFKAGEYQTAAALFSRAIDLGGEEPHVLHCNLAAALSALNRHDKALEACEASIKLQPSYVKAHYRKANALASVQKYRDALKTCEKALELNKLSNGPAAATTEKQLEALKEKCKENAEKNAKIMDRVPSVWNQPEYLDSRNAAKPAQKSLYSERATVRDITDPAEDKLEAIPAVVQPALTLPPIPANAPPPPTEAERKAAAATAAAEMADEVAQRKERMRAEADARDKTERERRKALDEALAAKNAAEKEEHARRRQQQKEEALSANAQTVACRAAVAERLANAVTDEGGGEKSGATVAAGAAAHQARVNVEAWRVKAMPTRAPLAAPRVPSDFTKQYALMRKDTAGLWGYLRMIPAEQCKAIFSPEVPSEVLVAVAKAIGGHVTAAESAWALEWLGGLSKAGRFEMTCLMLDKPSKAALTQMFDALDAKLSEAGKGGAGKETAALRKKYIG